MRKAEGSWGQSLKQAADDSFCWEKGAQDFLST